ncbi:hypothetical protein BDZ89DRAFT_650539 [Hymenopellis radicata]|nr:hypothetical protein BDZ89DRAFT_650539 [Hymenopellis radicata]
MMGLPPEAAPLSVSRLHVSGKWWCAELMSWLEACCTDLQTLDFRIQYPIDVATTALFLRANCRTLRYVTLSISGDAFAPIRLDMLQNLASLHLSLMSLDDSFYPNVCVTAAVGTVESLDPSHPPTTLVIGWSESADVAFIDTHYAALNSALVDKLGFTLVLQTSRIVSYQLS